MGKVDDLKKSVENARAKRQNAQKILTAATDKPLSGTPEEVKRQLDDVQAKFTEAHREIRSDLANEHAKTDELVTAGRKAATSATQAKGAQKAADKMKNKLAKAKDRKQRAGAAEKIASEQNKAAKKEEARDKEKLADAEQNLKDIKRK